jgi:phosphoinositide-3-kinase, regulatory subunit 4
VDIRFFAISIVNASCKALGFPDGDVFVIPLIRPYLRFEPSSHHLTTHQGLEKCLQRPWTRQKFQEELERFLLINQALSPTSGQWTSIGIQLREGGENPIHQTTSASRGTEDESRNAESEIDLQTKQVRAYLQLLGRSRAHSLSANSSESVEAKPYLRHGIEGPLKLAQHIKCPRQDVVGLPSATLPAWYSSLRDTHTCKTGEVSESAAIRSVSALGQVFGLSIMDQSVTTPASAGDMTAEEALRILQSDESKTIEAACTGEWGSETCLDPALTDTALLVGKLNALKVPPLPPRLTEEKPSAPRIAAHRVPVRADGTNTASADWKPKIDSMVASSSISPALGHTAPVVRMAVSPDQRFFVTGSHDGTCRVWELEKAERCAGVLESSITYSGHCPDGGGGNPRLNDLSMVEGSHSVVSGASDGSIHVWRVDMVSSKPSTANDGVHSYERSRVVGSSEVRRLDPMEGEILAVNHFNSSAASVLMFGTQKGNVHSWDLRCAKEPFVLRNAQGTGYLTSMGIGSDRHWVVTGSSKGFLALWDVRFQQQLKLWHHSRCAPINRVATSFVQPPQSWIGKNASSASARPFVFVACGPNEVAMFDVTNGACRECFRTVDYGSRHAHAYSEELPMLKEIPLTSSARQQSLMTRGMGSRLGELMSSSFLSTNAMVGSIGASDTSFLITGGSDCRIRHWDFIAPSKCYVISGLEAVQPRPSFERIDYDQRCRVMLCRQAPSPTIGEVESSRVPGKLFQGLKKPENHHHDSIQDLKIVNSGLLSCSRDCTVKLWR